MRFRNAAAAVAGMMLLAVSSFAQTAMLEGNVIGYDGKPLANAVIRLTRTDIKANYPPAKTDKKGHYIYMGLPSGAMINVAVEVDGKVVDQATTKASISSPQPVNFDLQKTKVAQEQATAAMQKAIDAGGQLTDDMMRGMSDEQKASLKKTVEDRADAIKKNKELNDTYTAGMTAAENKQWPEAVAAFEKATTMDPKQIAIWVNLAEAYMGDAGSKKGEERDAQVQKGIGAYNKAIELKPDDPAIHNNYGIALASVGKFTEAQDEMAKAAAIDPPGAGKYYYNAGAILVNTGKTDPAVEFFQKAIAADQNYGDAYYQLGVSLTGKATATPDGKVVPAPGTIEAYQKCIDLGAQNKCSAQFVEQAKQMIASLGATLQTEYKDPNAQKEQKSTTTKKKK